MNKPCAFCTGSGYPCLELRENQSGVSGDNPGERNTSCRLLHGNQGPHTVRGTSQRSIHGRGQGLGQRCKTSGDQGKHHQ